MVHFKTIEALAIPVFICSNKGEMLVVNDKMCKLLKYEKEQLLHTNFIFLNLPKFRYKAFRILKLTLETEAKVLETELKSATNHNIPVRIHISRLDKNLLVGVICDVSEFKQIEHKLLSTIINSEERERRRIATALHDDLSPILSALRLYVDLLKEKTAKETQDLINNIEQLTDLAIKTAKEISYNITPNILDDFGLAEAIKKFAGFVNMTKSLKINVKSDKYTLNKRLVVESILYQAAKELINNTIKHSKANKAVIELSNTDTMIILYYKDNGIGFDPAKVLERGNSLGLRNIIHKVASFGGKVQFHSEPGKGMMSLITVPINNEQYQLKSENDKNRAI